MTRSRICGDQRVAGLAQGGQPVQIQEPNRVRKLLGVGGRAVSRRGPLRGGEGRGVVGYPYISLGIVDNCANSVGFQDSVPLFPHLCPLSFP